MWPFSKKIKVLLSEEKTLDEEKLKPKIAFQLIIDPETKQLKIKSKESESPRKESESTLAVKLECPTCKQALEKYSRFRFKCPHCRNWIYYSRDDRLVTKEEYDRLRAEYNEAWLQRAKEEELATIGLDEAMIQRRAKDLLTKTGVTQNRFAVIQHLFNETILKLKDLNEMEERYRNLAGILNRAGEESFSILKAAAKTRLAIFRKEGFKNVSIVAGQGCEACRQLDGKVLSITEALRTNPLPIKECANYPWNEELSFCTCWYSSEWDEEYCDRQARKALEDAG